MARVHGRLPREPRRLGHERERPRLGLPLGRVGYVAKGVAFGIVGLLVIAAAATYDPEKSRGLDAALKTLAAQPYGQWLLSALALGIGCYGLYCFLWARYPRD